MNLVLVGEKLGWTPGPALMTAVAHELDIHLRYRLRELSPRRVGDLAAELRGGALDGCHVAPSLAAVLARECDHLEGVAKQLQLVDSIWVRDEELVGQCLLPDAVEQGLSYARMWPRSRSRAVIIGSGNVSAAVAVALVRAGVSRILLISRNAGAAARIAERLVGCEIVHVPWEPEAAQAAVGETHMLVNCTQVALDSLPFGMQDLPSRCTVADVQYLPRPVPLVTAAEASGRRACDGADIYLYQQLLPFRQWAGQEPPWQLARATLARLLTGAPR